MYCYYSTRYYYHYSSPYYYTSSCSNGQAIIYYNGAYYAESCYHPEQISNPLLFLLEVSVKFLEILG